MEFKKINRIFGAVVFLISAIVFLMTMQKTLSFWDCGEFAACAYTLSIPHPPGAPLFTLIGKVAMMVPIGDNPAVRMNAVSAFSTSFTALFLYLVTIIVMKNWRGIPKNIWDAVLMCGAATIGALSYTFSDAVWFNSLEAEVYALGTMLVGLCTWLLMHWWENAKEKGSERYLLVVAFVVGLALGIHLLVVQVILVGGMLIYFRKYEYDRKKFIISLILSAVAFFIVYPVIVIWFPTWLGGSINALGIENNSFVELLTALLVPVLLYGVYWAYNNNKRTISFVLSAVFLVILGYSIYAGVILRARVDNLPINENDPSNLPNLVKYLSREQYGDAPFWPRRYSQEPMHRRTWSNYTSDMDFMWRYQINHMFNRYLAWQYIGREGYMQDQGVDWSKFYGIPFLLGLFGLFYHFRKDWKLGLVFLWMFLLMGIFTALFQRQQDPQPRERDYFYVGAFFVFSMWIGIGIYGIIELIKESVQNSSALKVGGVVVLLLALIFVPINMARTNWKYQNRNNNYVPFDYAYNILQSADKDAIIFTNGDNDTFPIWYLQAAEGYRTDVRIVNLSLLNTDWYIKEMKNSMPFGSLKVPISMTDPQIEKLAPTQWPEFKMMQLNTPVESYPDTMRTRPGLSDKIIFRMPATINSGNVQGVKVQDLMIYDIIKTNNWQRPIYFSSTVTEDNYIGLDDYLVLEGLSRRLVPYKNENPLSQFNVNEQQMWEDLMGSPANYSKTPQPGYFYRGLNDPDIFFDNTHINSVQNYRTIYLTLAYYYSETNPGKAKQVLDRMNELFPGNVVTLDYRIMYDMAMLYSKIGDKEKFDEFSKTIEESALRELNRNPNDIQTYYNPYRMLIDIYEAKGEWAKGIDILQRLDKLAPGSPEVKMKLEMFNNKLQGR